jgi:hypothetical protein
MSEPRLRGILGCSIKSSMNGVEVYVMGDDMRIEEAVSGITKRINSEEKFFIVK